MPTFIKLTCALLGDSLWVNLDRVELMRCEEGRTKLFVVGGSDSYWPVRESPEQIVALMDKRSAGPSAREAESTMSMDGPADFQADDILGRQHYGAGQP